MLQTLHKFMHAGKPIYGMHRGTVGFLMNEYYDDKLRERLAAARTTVIHPLLMRRATPTATWWSFMPSMTFICSARPTRRRGCASSSTAGAAARAGRRRRPGVHPRRIDRLQSFGPGPIIPINASLMALTPISPFRPRRFRGALLPDTAQVRVEVLEPEKRPVAAVADHDEVRAVCSVDIQMDHSIATQMLFDPGHSPTSASCASSSGTERGRGGQTPARRVIGAGIGGLAAARALRGRFRGRGLRAHHRARRGRRRLQLGPNAVKAVLRALGIEQLLRPLASNRPTSCRSRGTMQPCAFASR
jgi:NAD+ kinase